MNPDLDLLQAYPFEKLRTLFRDITPNPRLAPITLGMGEPQHPAPDFVVARLQQELPLLAKYPATRGIPELREAIAAWLLARYQLHRLDPESQVLPVNGTREAIFALTQTVVDRSRNPLVLSPNPFYQIYEGASLLAGAQLQLLDCTAENNFLPDFDGVADSVWQRCQLLFLCSPGNPTGAVLPLGTLQQLIALAQKHEFLIASDECYAEIYADESQPPVGLLQACRESGLDDYRHCVVFHSLSKRSNLPGMRSGFVAGDAAILEQFLLYRTYHGCAMPLQHQWASISAWSDEEHVQENRRLYREKFDTVLEILGDCLPVKRPPGSFYLWPKTPGDDRDFACGLLQQENVTVLPGRFLARENDGRNPGENHVRLALVAPPEQCREAAHRIRRFSARL
ncbi:MAG: succinyldiaminopimelate transaminase [Gammaproteobacteria bacterium]|nr:succinyldiaminopimelate transaminase [Gammaproteobacteria bacterium]